MNSFSSTKHDEIPNEDSSDSMERIYITSDTSSTNHNEKRASGQVNMNPHFKKSTPTRFNRSFKTISTANQSVKSTSSIDNDPHDIQFGSVYTENDGFFYQGNDDYVVGTVKKRLDNFNTELEQVHQELKQQIEQVNSQFQHVVQVNSELENRIKFLEAKINYIIIIESSYLCL